MTINTVTPTYSVSPQISHEDLEQAAEQGFTTVICNRPDTEVQADLQSERMRETAERLGLKFVYNPVSPQGLTYENLDIQADAIDRATGPVLAYCRSGRRSTLCWSFLQAGRMATDEILNAAAGAGYQLDGIRQQIDAFAAQMQAAVARSKASPA